MIPISDTEDNPILLWAEIHRLRSELKGPDNFETWRDAAIDERVRRVEAESKLAKPVDVGPWVVDIWKGSHGGKRVVLQSERGAEDVALEISGNFATHEDTLAYANRLAADLNQIPDTGEMDLPASFIHASAYGSYSTDCTVIRNLGNGKFTIRYWDQFEMEWLEKNLQRWQLEFKK